MNTQTKNASWNNKNRWSTQMPRVWWWVGDDLLNCLCFRENFHRRRGCLFNLDSCQAQNINMQIYRPKQFALEKENKLCDCFPSAVAWILTPVFNQVDKFVEQCRRHDSFPTFFQPIFHFRLRKNSNLSFHCASNVVHNKNVCSTSRIQNVNTFSCFSQIKTSAFDILIRKFWVIRFPLLWGRTKNFWKAYEAVQGEFTLINSLFTDGSLTIAKEAAVNGVCLGKQFPRHQRSVFDGRRVIYTWHSFSRTNVYCQRLHGWGVERQRWGKQFPKVWSDKNWLNFF